MKLRKNAAAIDKVRSADMRGCTSEELKTLHMEANIFDADLDTPIYRIVELDRVKPDLKASRFTLTNAHPESWNDKLENPFLNLESMLDGEIVSIKPLLSGFYASCWSKNPDESAQSWLNFSYRNKSVRIKTTLRKVLDRLMCIDCDGYSLRYYAGAVNYCDQEVIEKLRQRIAGDAYLLMDTHGQELALSVMLIRTHFLKEQEIRILYSHMPNEWTDNYVNIVGKHCSHPFDWNDCVDEVICGPNMGTADVADFKEFLSGAGYSWPVKRSEFYFD